MAVKNMYRGSNYCKVYCVFVLYVHTELSFFSSKALYRNADQNSSLCTWSKIRWPGTLFVS